MRTYWNKGDSNGRKMQAPFVVEAYVLGCSFVHFLDAIAMLEAVWCQVFLRILQIWSFSPWFQQILNPFVETPIWNWYCFDWSTNLLWFVSGEDRKGLWSTRESSFHYCACCGFVHFVFCFDFLFCAFDQWIDHLHELCFGLWINFGFDWLIQIWNCV